MRRYMKRFIHLIEGLPTLGGVLRTKYNQYHSVVMPLKRYLRGKGVHFHFNTQVTDIDFSFFLDKKNGYGLTYPETQ